MNSKIIAEMIRLLSQRLEAKILENLLTNASRFWDMYDSDISHVFGMTKLPKLLQLDLLQQTSITESTYHHVNTSDRYVESKVYFACPGGEVMKVCGWIVGCNNQDGMLDIPYSDLKIEFTLPNGTMLKSESENEFFSDDPLETENPSPVTKLLLEAFSQNIQGPKLPGKLIIGSRLFTFLLPWDFFSVWTLSIDLFRHCPMKSGSQILMNHKNL